MNRPITVSAHKSDSLAFGVQKYDNAEEWNVPGGRAPNGVSATRYLRRTNPDVSQLTPLARWLFDHVPANVAGRMPHPQQQYRVRCFAGVTESDLVRRDFRAGGWRHRPGLSDEENARLAENMIRVYGLDSVPASISDWLFDQIEPHQTDEEYWNAQAQRMRAAGVVRVQIGNETTEVS